MKHPIRTLAAGLFALAVIAGAVFALAVIAGGRNQSGCDLVKAAHTATPAQPGGCQ